MSNHPFKIRQISMAEAWQLPWISWNLAKKNYGLALGASFVLIITTVFTYIPFIGIGITAFLNTFLTSGMLRLCRNWESGKNSDFSQIFIGFRDQILFKRLLPLAGFNLLIVLVNSSLIGFIRTVFSGQFLILTILFIITMGLHAAVTSFSTAIITFKSTTNLQQAILMSINIYFRNFVPINFAVILLGITALLSTLLFILPLFFFFIPMFLVYPYFLYRATCEDLILGSDKLSEEVGSS